MFLWNLGLSVTKPKNQIIPRCLNLTRLFPRVWISLTDTEQFKDKIFCKTLFTKFQQFFQFPKNTFSCTKIWENLHNKRVNSEKHKTPFSTKFWHLGHFFPQSRFFSGKSALVSLFQLPNMIKKSHYTTKVTDKKGS